MHVPAVMASTLMNYVSEVDREQKCNRQFDERIGNAYLFWAVEMAFVRLNSAALLVRPVPCMSRVLRCHVNLAIHRSVPPGFPA